MINNTTNDVINPFPKGTSGMSWFFEQQLYMPQGIARAVKAGEGSGNIPKVIVNVDSKISEKRICKKDS